MHLVSLFAGVMALLISMPRGSLGIMGYHNISSPTALCNDFSQAGMFIEKILSVPNASKKWIIFLESGGFCFSAESCNTRFFQSHIRSDNSRDGTSTESSTLLSNDFDPDIAWSRHKDGDLSKVISPLMTSVHRFRNTISDPGQFVVDGMDILSNNCEENPLFCEHRAVVLPYCSSDLWLGNDSRSFATKTGEKLSMESISEEDFFSQIYQPNSSDLQFVFQGANIFRKAIEDLLKLEFSSLHEAEEVILAGSSAGGVGAMNHANWLKKQLPPSAKLSLLLDSSWFINFNGVVEREFNGSEALPSSSEPTTNSSPTQENLFSIISWHRPCQELHINAPCCIAARCLLTNPDFFPRDTRVFTIVSLYDVFLLGASLRGLVVLASEEETLKPGYALDFLRTVSEYGGVMNRSISELVNEVDFVSFYVTECFQHIYLATSSLWGMPGESLFGESPVELGNDAGVIRHSIKSGVWSTFRHSPPPGSNHSYTIQDALTEWYLNPNSSFQARDSCQGPLCNKNCPEMFIPQELDSNSWLPSTKVVLVMVIVGIALACICLKVVFVLWLWKLEWKQQLYLGLLGDESYTADIEMALQFPDCSDKDAVSVACLDLCYTVKVRSQMKDERKDNVTPLVLSDLNPEDELEEGPEGGVAGEEGQEEDWEESSHETTGLERLPSRYKRMRRAKTRKTLRDAYQSYHHDNSSEFGQPEAIRKLRNIAERTFRGSRRSTHRPGSSSVMESDCNLSPAHFSGGQNFSYGSGHSSTGEDNPFTAKPVLADDNDHTPDVGVKSPPPVPTKPEPAKPETEVETTSKTASTPVKEEEKEEEGGGHEAASSRQKLISLPGRGLMLARQRTSFSSMRYMGREQKRILKGISLYFNPGELIGIMGPSGCGKTTFLDLLTGRRHTGTIEGNIYINGVRMDEVRDWYIANTGYVLQLATPYYEELTVRENLTLAAQIKLSNSFSLREKFQRVEQVMFVSGLLDLAETSVGGTTGPGLSGGQKRRLAVALQLLKLPSVIFLDEPTSGLDAASSFELLSHLNQLADSNRTVILTIHQPRLEIFHMFHRLVLLCDGKVAYHGIPERAYEVFVNALKTRYLEHGLIIPELEDHNPADVIMDILGNSKMRQIITDYYQSSEEPKYVKNAIDFATVKDSTSVSLVGTSTMNTLTRQFSYALYGAKKVQDKHAGIFYRLAALEARVSRRLNWTQTLYLPFIFFAYGLLLGTAYFQQRVPLLVMSGFCVYSVASALFMFPILFHYYSRALEVYRYEHGDGVGSAYDLIIQGFVHAISTAAVPVVVCAGVLYLLLVNIESYDAAIFGQLVIINLILNQCWTALLIALICAFPKRAFRLSPVISSVAGFASGFFIPIQEMHWGYRWLFYINPNYYGFSASAFLLLADFKTSCEGSEFECYTSSGEYVLNQFSFNEINPYQQALILLFFTALYLVLAIFSNWLRHTAITSHLSRVKQVIRRNSSLHSESLAGSGNADDRTSSIEKEGSMEGSGVLKLDVEGVPPSPQKYTTAVHFATSEAADENGRTGVGVAAEDHAHLEDGLSDHEAASVPDHVTEEESREPAELALLEEEKVTTPHGKISITHSPNILNLSLASSPDKSSVKTPSVKNVSFLAPEMDEEESTASLPPQQQSAYLKGGESHHVWKPSTSPAKPRQVALLSPGMKQKSQTQLLAKRKKCLEHRLLATREILKLQNEHYVSSPTTPAKTISFSEATKRISANILSSKREQSRDFHTIVDQYLSQMREEQEQHGDYGHPQWSGATTPMSPLTKPDTPTNLQQVFSSGSQSSLAATAVGAGPTGPLGRGGTRRNYGNFCLQPPRLVKRQQGPVCQASKSSLFSSPPSTPTTPSSPGKKLPQGVRAIPISFYRQAGGGAEATPTLQQRKGQKGIKHPLEKSSTEVAMASPFEVERKPRTQSFGGVIDSPPVSPKPQHNEA